MKKIVSVFLAFMIVASMFSAVTITASAYSVPDEAGFAAKLNSLRAQFPNGGYYSGTYYENGTAKAWECHGYALECFEQVFGIQYYNSGFYNRRDYTMGTIYAGDIVRTSNDGHTIFITKVEGDRIYFSDANYWPARYGANRVRWDVCFTYSQLAAEFTYKVHVPGNYLRGIPDPTPVNNPIGYLDIAESKSAGTIHVKGWAFDWDNTDAALDIHIYVGGPAGSGAPRYIIKANKERTDVNQVFPEAGNHHGFEETIAVTKFGNQDVYAYAINIGSGNDNPNLTLSPKTVNIIADNEKPTCESEYLSMVTTDSYRVCVVPKDNVGINNIRIATWTQSDQSDLIWHDALFNGYDTYFIDIYRADYSAKQNSYYFNHAYIYDFAGNWTLVSIPQDYRITSDTGKSVPEGEYRIVTAVNENKALDVENGSIQSGANIEIYSNLAYPNQTFNLKYLDNGFYSISNSRSNCVLDVYGDTYVNNTNVVQCNANGGPNQEWMIKPTGDGYYYIISRTNGLALDVTNADDRDGANVAVHTQNQSTAQKWKLRRVLNDNMVKVDAIISKENATVAKSSVTVTVDDNVLTEGIDYSLTTSYDSNTKALTATVIGLGNYCDTVTKTVTATLSVPKFLGDVDDDGDIEIRDSTWIQRHVAKEEMPFVINKTTADIDDDGIVTVMDATAIQYYLANMKTTYKIGEKIE